MRNVPHLALQGVSKDELGLFKAINGKKTISSEEEYRFGEYRIETNLFKFRMLPNGKKSNALRAEILGPCGGNLKEEIFP